MEIFPDRARQPRGLGRGDARGLAKGGFALSQDASNAAVKGANVRKESYPDGVPGTKFSLNEMVKAIQGDMANPKTVTALRSWAGRVLVAAGGPKTEVEQAQVILDELRKRTVYVQDPINTEMVVRPRVTLCLEDGQLCVPASDCDDRVTAYIALLMSVGIECRIVAQAFGTPQATHVIAAVRDTNTGWKRTDPSHASWPVGQFHAATREWWVDPVSGETRHSSDGVILKEGVEPNGVFIGVGAVPHARGFSPVSHESPRAREVAERTCERACPNTSCCGTCPSCDLEGDPESVAKSEGLGVHPMFHAFSVGSESASYVPVGLVGGLGLGQGMPAASATGTSSLSQDAMNVVVFQLQDAVAALEGARNDLGAALQNITRTRLASRGPNALFDPEPSYSIASVADFPTNGTTWTQSMDVIANQLFDIADRMVGFGYDALAGNRQILVDSSTSAVYVQSKADDAWSLHAVVQTADKLILGFFDKAGSLLSGIDAATGASLTADQVKTEATAAGVTGLGVAPIVVALAVVGVAAVAAAVYYSVKAFTDKAVTVAQEATKTELVKCVEAGTCNQSVIQANLDALAAARDATNKANPVKDYASIFQWVAIGGIAVSAAVVLGPFISDVLAPVVKRFTSGSASSSGA